MVTMPNNLVQLFFDSASVIMIAITNNEIVADINRKGCEVLDCTKEDVLGKNWFDVFVPEPLRADVKRLFHEMLNGPLRHVHSEYPVVGKHRKEHIINWHNILVNDEMGNIIGVLSSGSDVTEQRQAEVPIVKMENRLQATLDDMLEGVQIIDYDWRYSYINESGAKQGRRTKKELLGHTMMEMYPGIEYTKLFDNLRDCMIKRVPRQMENEFIFPDGSKGWFELRIEPAPEGILILSIDVTKRKELEAELDKYHRRLEDVVAERTSEIAKTNEQLVREVEAHRKMGEGLALRAMILDNAKEAIFLVNTKGNFAYANQSACKTYGYTLDEFLNMNLRQLLPPEEAHVIESRLREVIEKGQIELETVHVRKDKSLMPVRIRHSLIQTLHGQFIVSVMRDVAS